VITIADKALFIATTDQDTAEKLRGLGFQELPKEGNRWMFINDCKKQSLFSSEKMKVNYTNVLTF